MRNKHITRIPHYEIKCMQRLAFIYLCEVGVLCTRHEASEKRGAVEAHH